MIDLKNRSAQTEVDWNEIRQKYLFKINKRNGIGWQKHKTGVYNYDLLIRLSYVGWSDQQWKIIHKLAQY